MSSIRLSSLTKRFGPLVAVNELNLELRQGELVAFLGPSGCGKTTTLRMIAGFERADQGAIYLGGREVTDLPPERRDAGMVFRATQPSVGTDSYRGYYAGVTPTGRVVLGKADGRWTPLASAAIPTGTRHQLRVEAVGPTIKVYADDLTTPKITITDTTYTSGANGVRVFNTGAAFDDFAVTHR